MPQLRQQIISSLGNEAGRVAPRQFCELPAAFAERDRRPGGNAGRAFSRTPAAGRGRGVADFEQRKGAGLEPRTLSGGHPAGRGRGATPAGSGGRRLAQRGDRSPLRARDGDPAGRVTETSLHQETFSDKLDRVLTHKIWGTLIFVAIMALMFQSIFSFAHIPMDAIQAVVDWLGGVRRHG